MKTTTSRKTAPPFIAATAAVVFAFAPGSIGAQQGQNPGAITEGPVTKSPTVAILRPFAGAWRCTLVPGRATFEESGMMSAQGNAFTLRSPATQTRFTSSAGTLQFTRASAAGGTSNYALSSYAPRGVDLVFASTNPSERGGAAAANTFTPTFEIKRDAGSLVVTTKSPKFGTVVQTCRPS